MLLCAIYLTSSELQLRRRVTLTKGGSRVEKVSADAVRGSRDSDRPDGVSKVEWLYDPKNIGWDRENSLHAWVRELCPEVVDHFSQFPSYARYNKPELSIFCEKLARILTFFK